VLLVAGCEENQVKFHPEFDHIILLSAPVEILTQRLATRTSNSFGKSAGEYRRFLADLQEVEPLLRAIADCEIDTTMSISEVVRAILQAVGPRRPPDYPNRRLDRPIADILSPSAMTGRVVLAARVSASGCPCLPWRGPAGQLLARTGLAGSPETKASPRCIQLASASSVA